MFLIKQNFVCGVGREQNFVLNNKYDQLLPFLRYNCYLRVNCTLYNSDVYHVNNLKSTVQCTVLFKLFT